MEKKITKKEMFMVLRGIIENADVENEVEMVAFIDREIELLEKKHASNKETKTQIENKEVIEKIYNALAEIGTRVTVSELQAGNEEMAIYSNQKLSALLKKLVDCGRVTKVIEKKKSYFSVEI